MDKKKKSETGYPGNIHCRLHAKIISAGKTYNGFIENLSGAHLEYLTTLLTQVPNNFIPDKTVKLEFKNISGKTVDVRCETVWFVRRSERDRTMNVGMRIVEPLRKCRDLIIDTNVRASKKGAG